MLVCVCVCVCVCARTRVRTSVGKRDGESLCVRLARQKGRKNKTDFMFNLCKKINSNRKEAIIMLY